MFVHDLYAFNALHILLNDTVAVIPQLGVEWGKEKCNLLNLFGVQRKEYKPEEHGCLVIVNLFFYLQQGSACHTSSCRCTTSFVFRLTHAAPPAELSKQEESLTPRAFQRLLFVFLDFGRTW